MKLKEAPIIGLVLEYLQQERDKKSAEKVFKENEIARILAQKVWRLRNSGYPDAELEFPDFKSLHGDTMDFDLPRIWETTTSAVGVLRWDYKPWSGEEGQYYSTAKLVEIHCSAGMGVRVDLYYHGHQPLEIAVSQLPELRKSQLEKPLDQMTLEEKVDLAISLARNGGNYWRPSQAA